MRVLFDAYWWEGGPRANATVQGEIITAWMREYPNDDIGLALPKRSNFHSDKVTALKTSGKLHAFVNYFELPKLAKQWGADLVVTHNFTSPCSKAVSYVFIHDLLFKVKPRWFTLTENAYFRLMLPMSKNADQIFTSSADSSNLISSLTGRHVIRTGLAIPSDISNATPVKPVNALVSGKFLLTVGRLNARKNLAATIEAYLKSDKSGPLFPLVVVGQPSGKVERVSHLIEGGLASGSLIFLQDVGEGELAWLYLNAESLLFFTLGEGFGIPIIEAIHFGLPVRVSDIGVFRELLGDQAVFADPNSIDSLTQAIDCKNIDPPTGSTFNWSDVVAHIRNQAVEALDVE
jgi:glycosyltransferase involved in cell wall biosynthesis